MGHEAWYFLERQSGACTWEVPDGARPAPEAPLLVVLPVDDLRRCGLSSPDAEEARLVGVLGSVASDYLVPGLFPTIPEVLWADDWHFTETGAKTFAKWLAQNLRKYLVSLARYKAGMLVHVVSDSTFDFLNWDSKWRWVGKGDAIFKDAFAAQGLVLSLDVAGSTGFVLGTNSAGSFPARLRERREACAAGALAEVFDCVLVVGGYNDVHRRRRVAEGALRTGVGETLRECLLLLQAGPSKLHEEPCSLDVGIEANERSFGYVPLARGEQASYHEEMFMNDVLCSEPKDFSLQNDEDWTFWGQLSWLEIAKAMFVQASVLRNDYVWNVNKCKKRQTPPFKRLCENAMWYHEKQAALPSSMHELREALGWDGRDGCVFDRLCQVPRYACKKCGGPGEFWRRFKKNSEPFSPECREVWCCSCNATRMHAFSVGNGHSGCFGSLFDINDKVPGPTRLVYPECSQQT